MRALAYFLWLFLTLVVSGCGSKPSMAPRPPTRKNSAHQEPVGPAADPEDLALAETKRALSRGVLPEEVIEPTYGLTRIHVAARNGHEKVLRYLIEHGGDVDVHNTGGLGVGGETPLHWASTGR